MQGRPVTGFGNEEASVIAASTTTMQTHVHGRRMLFYSKVQLPNREVPSVIAYSHVLGAMQIAKGSWILYAGHGC